MAKPLLRFNNRLADGYDQRVRLNVNLQKVDIWIQAASAGESYLACHLMESIAPQKKLGILVTTNTRQGMDILTNWQAKRGNPNIRLEMAFFPFDHPDTMKSAVIQIKPRLLIMLETEIWPGLLAAVKSLSGCKSIILNGRMSPGSFRYYRLWPSFCHALRPDHIQAITPADARRFATVFGMGDTEVVSNMKFDRIQITAASHVNPLRKYIAHQTTFCVLGSVRQEEEADVLQIIQSLRQQCPQVTIGLFPRHMHRTPHWRSTLKQAGVSTLMRTRARGPIAPGTVVLWDAFGELQHAFELAGAAFIGGSLAPLGGQNFLEAVACGVIPVIGPHWRNFHWVGRDIFISDLVYQGSNWKTVADRLIGDLKTPPKRQKIRQAADAYIKIRQGGTLRAINLMEKYLGQTLL
jgi:3-deoxy-D-manno-octulosonic-acid transferase